MVRGIESDWEVLSDLLTRSIAKFVVPGEDCIAVQFGDGDRASRQVNVTAHEITMVCTQVLDSGAKLAVLKELGFESPDSRHDWLWNHDSVGNAREIAVRAVGAARLACDVESLSNLDVAGGGPSAQVGEEFFGEADFPWVDAARWTGDSPDSDCEDRELVDGLVACTGLGVRWLD